MELWDNMGEKIKLPPGRVWQLPTELDRLWEGVEDIGVGPPYMGIIRKSEMHVELSGPKTDYTGFLQTEIIYNSDEVVDGKVTVIGPEASELPQGISLPGGIYFKVYGRDLRMDHSEYLFRSIIDKMMTSQERSQDLHLCLFLPNDDIEKILPLPKSTEDNLPHSFNHSMGSFPCLKNPGFC
jgi:hypothetical protein